MDLHESMRAMPKGRVKSRQGLWILADTTPLRSALAWPDLPFPQSSPPANLPSAMEDLWVAETFPARIPGLCNG